jgi:hypothetical protein
MVYNPALLHVRMNNPDPFILLKNVSRVIETKSAALNAANGVGFIAPFPSNENVTTFDTWFTPSAFLFVNKLSHSIVLVDTTVFGNNIRLNNANSNKILICQDDPLITNYSANKCISDWKISHPKISIISDGEYASEEYKQKFYIYDTYYKVPKLD